MIKWETCTMNAYKEFLKPKQEAALKQQSMEATQVKDEKLEIMI